MDKFWKWMEEKQYSRMSIHDEQCVCDIHKNEVTFTKQMLIGYMMEYCCEKNIFFKITSVHFWNAYNILKNDIKHNETSNK